MSEIKCKRCGEMEYVKNGKARGLQRYKCKKCKYNFTDTGPRGKPEEVKAMAVRMYGEGGMSFRGIAKILNVSDVAVLQWVRKEAEALPEPEMPEGVEVVMLDEMHHFLKKRQAVSGISCESGHKG